ncbi:MAG: hypothetical protein ACYS9X_31280 [Planctomycetota bacterium]|jgi:hypothetical protein
MGVLRRDLTGAFRTAVAMYDFSSHSSGSEFHWEAPLGGNPANGFRRVTFVSAIDGSRPDVPPADYPLRPFDYERVSWSVRGGMISRAVFCGGVTFEEDPTDPLPPGWRFSPYPNPDPDPPPGQEYLGGVKAGQPTCDVAALPAISDPGVYRGTAYVVTTPYAGAFSSRFGPKDAGGTVIPQPVTAILCFPSGESVPDWALLDFKEVQSGGLEVGGGACRLFARSCPDGRAAAGPNVTGSRYFAVIEPGWWSMGEEAEDLVFYPPTGYTPTLDAATGVYEGGVPRYVDIRLKISDPDYKATLASVGVRTFCERVAIPAGVEP